MPLELLPRVVVTIDSAPVSRAALGRFLGGAPSARVVVVGDVMVDEYIFGSVERVSPEAPVPVLTIDHEHRLPGGAAHVAHVIRALGASPDLVGLTGADSTGAELRSLCAQRGIDTTGLIRRDGYRTPLKTRVISGAQQLVRLDRENRVGMADGAPPGLFEVLRERVADCDLVVVSDYAKGLLGLEVLGELMALCQSHRVPVLVDPKHRDLSRYRGASILKLNLEEFAAAAPGNLSVDRVRKQLTELAPRIRSEAGADVMVVTLGKEGMVVFSDGSPPTEVPGSNEEVFDVTGAGDVVAGVLALGLVVGLDVIEASSLANLAAGVSVRHRGVRPVHPHELMSACGATGRDEVVISHRELDSLCGQWRTSGERIVFTNGCFDLLHPGHLHLLHRAAALGDRLVVAVDSDPSVRRLKGSRRPQLNENERARMVAALDVVDAVVVFDEDLVELIVRVQPSVLVKGADYRGRSVVGAEQVEAEGGRVELVPLLEGHSTSAMLDAMDRPARVGAPASTPWVRRR